MSGSDEIVYIPFKWTKKNVLDVKYVRLEREAAAQSVEP